MKSLLAAMALVAGLGLGGCSIAIRATEIEATDLSPLRVGAPRQAVEDLLGEPIARGRDGPTTVATYLYDRGARGERITYIKEYLGLYGMFFEPILTPIALVSRASRVQEQKRELVVTYDPAGLVVDVDARYTCGEACRRALE